MTQAELLRLVEAALLPSPPARLGEELLAWLLGHTGAKAGILLNETRKIAEIRPESADIADEAWSDFPFVFGPRKWMLRLLKAQLVEQDTLGVLRIILRALSLQGELKRARFDKRFHLWELEVIRSIGSNINHLEDPGIFSTELLSHLISLLGLRSAQIYLQSDKEPAGSFGTIHLRPEEVKVARTQVIFREELIALPLVGNQENLGVLVAAEKEARTGIEAFAEEDQRLLELFAVQISVALEYAAFARKSLERDRMKRELEVAGTIQRHILPQEPPEIPGFNIVANSTPSLQVGGDTYDIIPTEDGVVLAITDVSGKGVGAGLIASGIHAGIRLLIEEELYLEDLSARLNRYLCGATENNRFATFAMVRISRKGELHAVNAGHCPILLRSADGRVRQIASSGLPLGIMETGDYRSEFDRLEAGDMVFLYTDGFTEAEDGDEQEFGVPGVIETIASSPGDLEHTTQRLFRRIEEYTCGRPLADDATLVAVEYLGRDSGSTQE